MWRPQSVPSFPCLAAGARLSVCRTPAGPGTMPTTWSLTTFLARQSRRPEAGVRVYGVCLQDAGLSDGTAGCRLSVDASWLAWAGRLCPRDL